MDITNQGNNYFIHWLMGPTSSGKTTIAENFTILTRKRSIPVIHYDGDEVRNFFGSDFGFAPGDRLKVVKTLVYLANKSAKAGSHVVVSALTANLDARKYVTENLINGKIVYLKCPIEVCAARDPKGLYNRAERGEITTLVGYNSVYIPPDDPALVLDTGRDGLEEVTEQLEIFFHSLISN
jgi:adenylylsulfate kinase